jgi:hypothetical protein
MFAQLFYIDFLLETNLKVPVLRVVLGGVEGVREHHMQLDRRRNLRVPRRFGEQRRHGKGRIGTGTRRWQRAAGGGMVDVVLEGRNDARQPRKVQLVRTIVGWRGWFGRLLLGCSHRDKGGCGQERDLLPGQRPGEEVPDLPDELRRLGGWPRRRHRLDQLLRAEPQQVRPVQVLQLSGVDLLQELSVLRDGHPA